MKSTPDVPPHVLAADAALRDAIPAAESAPLPPWSLEAEQSVLGAVLIDTEAHQRVADLLRDGSPFYDARHRAIWAAASALAASRRPVDIVTVSDALEAAGQDRLVGGLAYLSDVARSVPSAAQARHYAAIVVERQRERDLLAAADRVRLVAADRSVPVAERADRAAAELAGIARAQQRSAPRPIAGLVAEAIDRFEKRAQGGAPNATPTGIRPLDRALRGGLEPGRVYVVAARPGCGKSSLARTIAISAAERGRAVLMLSLEMPAEEVTDCIVAQLGSFDPEGLVTGKPKDEDWTALTEAGDRAMRLPIHVDDEGALTAHGIRAKARSVRDVGLIVIDYLQLCGSTLPASASTNDKVAEVSKAVKALALEFRVPIILLSQLNREVERRSSGEPQLSDLRDSGSVEQDADVVLMLWHLADDDASKRGRKVGVRVAKNRAGPRPTFAMRWRPEVNAWRETDEPMNETTADAPRRAR